MWTTLYTDASFYPDSKQGGWAIWARSELGRMIRSGSCPQYVVDSNDAELCAMYAGIYLVGKHWPQTERILICSDSTTALSLLKYRERSSREVPARLQGLVQGVCSQHGFKLVPRWVKGHSSANTIQAYLNNKCDEFAREAVNKGMKGKICGTSFSS